MSVEDRLHYKQAIASRQSRKLYVSIDGIQTCNTGASMMALRRLALRPALKRPAPTPKLASSIFHQSRQAATHPYNHYAKLLSGISSIVDKSSENYKENAAQMHELIERMQVLHRRVEEGGPTKAKEKHVARGKMLPRE